MQLKSLSHLISCIEYELRDTHLPHNYVLCGERINIGMYSILKQESISRSLIPSLLVYFYAVPTARRLSIPYPSSRLLPPTPHGNLSIDFAIH